MKNKYYILMYVAAILGGVLGAYLCARNSITAVHENPLTFQKVTI